MSVLVSVFQPICESFVAQPLSFIGLCCATEPVLRRAVNLWQTCVLFQLQALHALFPDDVKSQAELLVAHYTSNTGIQVTPVRACNTPVQLALLETFASTMAGICVLLTVLLPSPLQTFVPAEDVLVELQLSLASSSQTTYDGLVSSELLGFSSHRLHCISASSADRAG